MLAIIISYFFSLSSAADKVPKVEVTFDYHCYKYTTDEKEKPKEITLKFKDSGTPQSVLKEGDNEIFLEVLKMNHLKNGKKITWPDHILLTFKVKDKKISESKAPFQGHVSFYSYEHKFGATCTRN